MTLLKDFRVDKLNVKVFDTRRALGGHAAREAIVAVKELLDEKEEINIIFAAAPSQSEFLDEITSEKSIDWSRVNALHLDEYIGLPKDAEQRFAHFLHENVFSKADFKNVFVMNFSENKVEDELARYEKILRKHPIDVAFIGIGENGHIAFNDPGVADFNDPLIIKEVELDMKCRQQQVNDKCFETIDDVPKTAATVTVPWIVKAKKIFCMVPAITKADAVKRTLNGEINEECPATILRRHDNATLYLDKDSGKYIL